MEDIRKEKTIISKETLLPVGFAIALCAGAVWMSTQLNNINYKLDSLEEKLEDQWTKRDMTNWALNLKLQNPNLELPVIKN